jgi:hypothetical protein
MRTLVRGRAWIGALAVFGTFAAIACGASEDKGSSSGGGGGGSGGDEGDARTFFIEKVHEPLATTCKECHGTGKNGAPVFFGATGDATYTALEGFPGLISAPNVSPIIQKGAHSGPALTDTENTLVTTWLKLEVTQRKLDADPNTPKNLRAAFKAFGACMDYGRWQDLKLYTIPATDTDNNQGQCRSCHNFGQASLWLSGGNAQSEADNAITFLKFREFPFVQRLVVGTVKEGTPGDTDENNSQSGAFNDIGPSNRLIQKGNEAQQQQANSHPRFSLSSDLSANLTTFVLETISNMNQGNCAGSSPDAGTYDAATVGSQN